MRTVAQSVVCERVRSQISLEMDGELSELERRMLEAHVARCGECGAFRAEVAAFTGELRRAPLAELDHPIVLLRPRRVAFARMQVGVAAAVAVVVVGALAQIAGSKPGQSAALSTPDRYMTSTQLTREIHQIVADGRAFGREGGSAIAI